MNNVSFRLTRTFLFLSFMLCVCDRCVIAAPGSFDNSFGVRGKALDNLSGSSSSATSSALQPDGKIITVGRIFFNNISDSVIIRFNTDGSIDNTFGNGGQTVTSISPGNDAANYAVIQPDGKILVVGFAYFLGYDCFLARYNPNGTIDSSFGDNGIVIINASDVDEYVTGLALQTDGKVLVLDRIRSNPSSFALVRYNTDGTLDTGFNDTGQVVLSGYTGEDIKIQRDGKIVVAGAKIETDIFKLTLIRFNSNGAFDNSFDEDGIVSISVRDGIPDYADTVMIQPDGKLVAAGNSSQDFAIARFKSDGTLDTSFGNGGKTVVLLTGSIISSAALQSNGKILVGGKHFGYSNQNFTLFRLNSDGSLDKKFGNQGTVRVLADSPTGVPGGTANHILIQADGKILGTGESFYSAAGQTRITLVRLISNGEKITDFDGDTKSDISVFRPAVGFWYRLNSVDNSFSVIQFGLNTDKLAPADYDGDGKTDIAVFRNGAWFILQSSNNSFADVRFGINGDVPVPNDYDGDGKADVAVFRQGNWYIVNSANGNFRAEQFGVASDKPILGDFDGDGKADLSVYRDGIWYISGSGSGFAAWSFGIDSDQPVAADYDGDGRTDLAVYRDGIWYLQQSLNGFAAIQFGVANDKPVPADYDGDGQSDLAVYRNGNWFISQTSNGFRSVQFGQSDDVPVPAAFLP